MLMDAVLVGAGYFLSLVLGLGYNVPQEFLAFFKLTVAGIVLLKLPIFFLFRLYKVIWRHIGMVDLFNIVKANALCSMCLVGGLLIANRGTRDFVAIVIVDGLLSLFLVAGLRIAIRLAALAMEKEKDFMTLHSLEVKKRKIVIVGAGEVGEKVFREIRDNGRLRYEVVGFLDDDPRKMGLNIHGMPVLGGMDKLGDIGRSVGLDEVIIAIGASSGSQMRRIVRICEDCGLACRTIPVVGDILNGQVSVNRFRPVSYEDLLGRPAVALDRRLIEAFLDDKTVLVTGGGGSIGSELCRQVSQLQPKHLVICDNSENNLYQIEIELRQLVPGLRIHPILADVRNLTQMQQVFKRHEPRIVIHAAAYKHVPMMELYPWEAVKNNIVAALNVLTLSEEENTERFVLVSTDKAVRPHSVMGATKRVAELLSLALSARRTQTRFMIVRFGNVAGSDGSVIPLFKKQIERGGPVTVTHPDITRYFMTVPEAAQLILQAGAMGEGGEIFILDMGRPIKILDMARDLIRLSGLEPDEDIDIKFIGLRPGEKLCEELVADKEVVLPTAHERIMAIQGQACRLDWVTQGVKELVECAERCDAEAIQHKLTEIVPEYTPYVSAASSPR